VADLEDHAPDLGRVGVLDRVLEPAEAEGANGVLLIALALLT
jgi:hypothetical protein